LGIVVNWTISTPNSGLQRLSVDDTDGVLLATLSTIRSNTTLNVTRNYSDQKLLLRAQLVEGFFNSRGVITGGNAVTDRLTGNPLINYEFTVKANSVAAIRARVLEELEDQFISVPKFVQFASQGATLIENLYEFTSSDSLELDSSALISFEIATTEDGYYVLPGAATLTGTVEYFVVVRQSGLTRDTGSGVFNTTGFLGGSGLTGGSLFGSSGAIDIPFLVISASTGEVFLNNSSDDAFVTSGITAPVEFEITIITRVKLNTDSNPDTFEINDTTLRQDVVLFKNPTA
jgi:hypothetical protein